MFYWRVSNEVISATEYTPDPEIHALLFKDGCGPQGLKCASIGLSEGVSDLMKDALLFHANTLVTLEIESSYHWNGNPRIMDHIRNVASLLKRCRSLKQVRLLDYGYTTASMFMLLSTPWGCQGLEQLVIRYWPSERYLTLEDIPRKFKRIEAERKRIRQSAWPRKLRHHEYSDDGQGWFLTPGLDRKKFIQAIIDRDWKRLLFEHMYENSGIRKAKYIRLNQTEFFAQEQHFRNIEAERKEMIEQEDLVVDYRKMMHPKDKKGLRLGRLSRGMKSMMNTASKWNQQAD
ncbi:hypothetical protein BGX31_007645 [Mortierella sp. GBA43]|nr:hypothetical protein BGX31_007645 [Mortierella sp. GBA43]